MTNGHHMSRHEFLHTGDATQHPSDRTKSDEGVRDTAMRAMIRRLLRQQRRSRFMSLQPVGPSEPDVFRATWRGGDSRIRQSRVRITDHDERIRLTFADTVPDVRMLRLLQVTMRPGPFAPRNFSIALNPAPQQLSKSRGKSTARRSTLAAASARSLNASTKTVSADAWEIEADIRWRNSDVVSVVITNTADCPDLENVDELEVVLEVRGIWSEAAGFEDRSALVRLKRNDRNHLADARVLLEKPSSPSGYVDGTLRPLSSADVHLLDECDEEMGGVLPEFVAHNEIRVLRSRSDASPDSHSGYALQICDPDSAADSRLGCDDVPREAAPEGHPFFLRNPEADVFAEYMLRQNTPQEQMTADEARMISYRLIDFLPQAGRRVMAIAPIRRAGLADDVIESFIMRILHESHRRRSYYAVPERYFNVVLKSCIGDTLRRLSGSRRKDKGRVQTFSELSVSTVAGIRGTNGGDSAREILDFALVAQQMQVEMSVYTGELPRMNRHWWELSTTDDLHGRALEEKLEPLFPPRFISGQLRSGDIRGLNGAVRTLRERTPLLLAYCVAAAELDAAAAAEERPGPGDVATACTAFIRKQVHGWRWPEVEKALNLKERKRRRLISDLQPTIRLRAAVILSAYAGKLCSRQLNFSRAWLGEQAGEDELRCRFDLETDELQQLKRITGPLIVETMHKQRWNADVPDALATPVPSVG